MLRMPYRVLEFQVKYNLMKRMTVTDYTNELVQINAYRLTIDHLSPP